MVRTYSCTDTVGLVGAVLNGVVALRDSVVEIGTANHCEGCRRWERGSRVERRTIDWLESQARQQWHNSKGCSYLWNSTFGLIG